MDLCLYFIHFCGGAKRTIYIRICVLPSLAKSFAGALVALASASAAVARLTHARAATSITAARAILPLDGHSLHTQSVPVTQIRKRLFAVTIHNTIYGHFGFVKR